MSKEPIEAVDGGCLIHIYATPRASRTQVAGLHDGMLKIQIAAPPVDGAANDALLAFLALSLQLPKKALRLLSGQSSKRKTILAEGEKKERVCAVFGLLGL